MNFPGHAGLAVMWAVGQEDVIEGSRGPGLIPCGLVSELQVIHEGSDDRSLPPRLFQEGCQVRFSVTHPDRPRVSSWLESLRVNVIFQYRLLNMAEGKYLTSTFSLCSVCTVYSPIKYSTYMTVGASMQQSSMSPRHHPLSRTGSLSQDPSTSRSSLHRMQQQC